MQAPVRPFMDAAALHARLQFVLAYVPLAQAHPDPSTITGPEPSLRPLFDNAEHGNITGVEPAHPLGERMVAVSIQHRTPRFFMPLDYVALDLAAGFGLRLTLRREANGGVKRWDHPRIVSPGPQGMVFHVLRILGDAQPGEVVIQKAHGDGSFDKHYLGRDGLIIIADDAVRGPGSIHRQTRRGRIDLLRRAEECFVANLGKADLPASLKGEDYVRLLTLAFALSDWRHGRLDGQLPVLMRPLPDASGLDGAEA